MTTQTKTKQIWKINQGEFISWRYEGCSDDIEDLDFSDEIIESLKEHCKYEFTLTIDNIIHELGYMPCRLIENFVELNLDTDDGEVCPMAEDFEVEWT